MFASIARFEWRYQMGNPVFWVATILFFLLTLGAVSVESVRLGSGGNIHSNAPTAIAQVQLLMSMLFMFVTTAFVSNVVVRDDETGFGSIIRSTRIGKVSYLFGRFTGACLGAAVAFLVVPLAIWIATFMPWVNPEFIGPNRLQDYLFPYLVFALPNILITSAIFFAIASWTRSVTYSYLACILFMFSYFALTAMLRKWPDLSLAAFFEPFGTMAYGLGVRYLTPIQSNTQALELTGLLISHRLVWLSIASAILVVAVWRFRFAERGATKRVMKRQEKRAQKLAAVKPLVVDQLPYGTPGQAAWHQLKVRALLEMKLVFKSPAFWVLAVYGVINLYITLNTVGRLYGVPTWPRTFAIVDAVRGNSAWITLLLAIYFSGEAMWRERDRRFNEIIDATPFPNWIFLVSKLLGVVGALTALSVVIVLLEAILFQLAHGVTDIEWGRWGIWFVLPGFLYVLHYAVLAIVVQAVSPNKFVGWGIMLLYMIFTTVAAGMGLDHPLINYPEAAMPLSDMNSAHFGGATSWWLRAWWSVLAVVLVLVGHLMWRRGTAVTLKGQWRTLPARLRGQPLVFLASALIATVGLGGFLFYNMNVLNQRISQDEQNLILANYEKEYSKYIDTPQPSLTDITLDVDLQPSRGYVRFDGSYTFTNATDQPIELLHVRMLAPSVSITELDVPGARLLSFDEGVGHRIFEFESPLQPGASSSLSFQTVVEKRGIAALPGDRQMFEFDAQPAVNGAYLTSLGLTPHIVMNRSGFLQGNTLRRKFGLPEELPTPELEDDGALSRSYVGVDRVNTDITVTTDEDQVLVVTGELVSESVADGRRTARFVSPIPTLNFITIQSARYAVKTADANGVDVSVYYHPDHPWNIDRMLGVMQDSLAYFQENYGPYQYNYARIIERPGYGGGANSAPGTVGYSENVGFTMNLQNPKTLDFLGYVTAHELAHQWWFHQVMPADVQGAEVLTETLSQYSALMVMKHRYGPDQIRQFLKYELDIYLQGRRQETAEEQPLGRVNKQGYIHYNKGSIVMYLIQDRLGEERVNTVLRGLIDRYRFKPAPFARSSDLVDGLLELARSPQERELVLDQFYRITLYDLKAKSASVRSLPDGQFETTITVAAGKSYADGEGNEETAPFDEQVDIGVFTERPGEAGFGSEHVLSIQRLAIKSGEQQVRIITAQRPVYAAVDPYINFIDRTSGDNILPVSSADD
jgi:ABC-2 type transport system permease protein